MLHASAFAEGTALRGCLHEGDHALYCVTLATPPRLILLKVPGPREASLSADQEQINCLVQKFHPSKNKDVYYGASQEVHLVFSVK